MIEELEKKISALIEQINGSQQFQITNSPFTYPDPAVQIKELSQALLHLRQAEYWKNAAELGVEPEGEDES